MNGAAYSEGYTYNSEDGSLNTMTTGVGTTLTMGYDGLRRLTSVTGGPVTRQYTYRDIDSTKTTLQVASVTSGGQQYGYTYDSIMYGIFINWVNHKADWDIKRQDPWNRTIGTPYPGSGTKVIYNGYVMTLEDIGNFTYGYLGRAFDFSETELIIGSWVAASFPLGGDALENERRDRELYR